MRSAGSIRTGVAVAACLWAASAGAQTPVTDGGPGLLGRSPHQKLDVTVSASGAYDDNFAALQDETVPNPGAGVGGGAYQGLSAKILYTRKFRYATLDLNESSSARRYPSLIDSAVLQHAASGAFTFHKRQTTFGVSQSAVTSPFYSYSTVPSAAAVQPGQVLVSSIEQNVLLQRTESYGSTVVFTQGFGRRLSASFSGAYANINAGGNANGLQTAGGSGGLTYRLADGLGLVAGYSYEEGRSTFDSRQSTSRFSTVNLGLDFSRALTVSRSTTFAMHTGTAAVDDSLGKPAYQVIGDAQLSHRFGRSWGGAASFRRSIGFIDGLLAPTLANGVALGLDGQLSRRVGIVLNGGYARDRIGVATEQNASDSYSGSATMRVGLTRLVTLSTSYVYYNYRFHNATALADGIPQRFDRQELRFGIDVLLPLVR